MRNEKAAAAVQTKRTLPQRIWDARMAYLFLLPGLVYMAIFRYIPIAGLTLAFRNFNARLGIWNSPWIGFTNFQRLFITPRAISAIINTLEISLGRLVFEFPIPIIIAILFNEMRGTRAKKLYQTVVTFPHFLSWVIVATILQDFFGTYGVVNYILKSLGLETVNFLTRANTFRAFVYFTADWKEAGWSSIIFIASLAGINPELYEAASTDGAGRLRRIWHVTLPGLRTTIITMLILKVGGSMNAGFEQIFNLRNPVVLNNVDIIDTYVYDITFAATPNYGFSTAVGLFKSVVNCVLLVVANISTRVLFGQGLFGAEKEGKDDSNETIRAAPAGRHGHCQRADSDDYCLTDRISFLYFHRRVLYREHVLCKVSRAAVPEKFYFRKLFLCF